MSNYPDKRDERTSHGIAIINPYGGIWTDTLFKTPEEAAKYLRNFWGQTPFDPSKWRLAKATATITLDRKLGGPTLIPLPEMPAR